MKNKKIRILYTIPNFDTAGSGIALMKLITGLDKELFDISIAVNHTRGEYFKNVVAKSKIPVYVLKVSERHGDNFRGFVNALKVAKFYRKHRFDIVYSYGYSSDFWEGLAARLGGAKWIWVKKNLNWAGSTNKYWRLRTFFANRVSVENRYMLSHFFNNTPKVIFNPISIDTKEFYPCEKNRELLKQLNLTDDDKVILSLANMVRRKSVETLINAIDILKSKGVTDFKCLIMGGGDPEYIAELKALVDNLGLNDLIMFIGKSYETHKYYSIADLFVINSLSEAGPATVLESMASGVITLGTKVGGMLDRLAEFPDQLCTPGNALELSEKIDKYLHLPAEEKDSISNHQVQVIQDQFSLDDEIKRHTSIYQDLMK